MFEDDDLDDLDLGLDSTPDLGLPPHFPGSPIARAALPLADSSSQVISDGNRQIMTSTQMSIGSEGKQKPSSVLPNKEKQLPLVNQKKSSGLSNPSLTSTQRDHAPRLEGFSQDLLDSPSSPALSAIVKTTQACNNSTSHGFRFKSQQGRSDPLSPKVNNVQQGNDHNSTPSSPNSSSMLTPDSPSYSPRSLCDPNSPIGSEQLTSVRTPPASCKTSSQLLEQSSPSYSPRSSATTTTPHANINTTIMRQSSQDGVSSEKGNTISSRSNHTTTASIRGPQPHLLARSSNCDSTLNRSSLHPTELHSIEDKATKPENESMRSSFLREPHSSVFSRESSPTLNSPFESFPRGAKRRFPGPAGLVTSTGPVVPGQTPSGRDWKAITSSKGRMTNHVPEDEEEIEVSLANSPAWVLAKEQLARLDPEGKVQQFNTAWIRQRTSQQEALPTVDGCQIPVFLCLVKSIDLENSNAPCKLVDQLGQVSGILSKNVLENYGDVVQAHSVLLLRKVPVFVTACSQFVNISSDNLVAVFQISGVTQVADLSINDIEQALPMKKGRVDQNDNRNSLTPPSNHTSLRLEAFAPDTRVSPRNTEERASCSNFAKPTSHTLGPNSSTGSSTNLVRMPLPSRVIEKQSQPLRLGQTPAQTSVRPGQTAMPRFIGTTTTPKTSSNLRPGSSNSNYSSQLPSTFPTPPVFNFRPTAATSQSRTPAPSQRLLDSLMPADDSMDSLLDGLDEESLFGDF